MMAAYNADGTNNVVVHVADVALDANKTGWNGEYSLLQDVQIKTWMTAWLVQSGRTFPHARVGTISIWPS